MFRPSLWSVVALLSCAACGSDAGGLSGQEGAASGDDDAGIQNPDITIPEASGSDAGPQQPGEAFPGCGAVPSTRGYEGSRIWTQADAEACLDLCPEGGLECINSTCAPGGEQFYECLAVEVASCMRAPGSPCRDEWEQEYCCVSTRCDLDGPVEEAATCVENSCAEQLADFDFCRDVSYRPCLPTAVPSCLAGGDVTEPAPTEGEVAPGAEGTRALYTPALRALDAGRLSSQLKLPALRLR